MCGDLTSAFDFQSASDHVPPLPSVAAYKPKQTTTPPHYHPVPPAVGSVPSQEPGVRPSRRLGYRLHLGFDADRGKLHLSVNNQGSLGVGLQARSLTVAGAPYSYTIGAGHQIAVALPNPGTYDLSLHGPNGFFRHFAGSPATTLRVEEQGDHDLGKLKLRITHRQPSAPSHRQRRQRVRRPPAHHASRHHRDHDRHPPLRRLVRHRANTPSDTSFSYQLAGRLESRARLTSDPQLGR